MDLPHPSPATEQASPTQSSQICAGISVPDTIHHAIENPEQEQSPVHLQDKYRAKPSLLASLWSPLSSLLSSPSPSQDTPGSDESPNIPGYQNESVPVQESNGSDEQSIPMTKSPPNKEANQPQISSSAPPRQNSPIPKSTPKETPTYLRLQKTRLSGTRTKQLRRAGSRAYDDPPPPPELGTCCGSSCDPCVNDLWREERQVWREVWGDDALGRGNGEGGGRLEW